MKKDSIKNIYIKLEQSLHQAFIDEKNNILCQSLKNLGDINRPAVRDCYIKMSIYLANKFKAQFLEHIKNNQIKMNRTNKFQIEEYVRNFYNQMLAWTQEDERLAEASWIDDYKENLLSSEHLLVENISHDFVVIENKNNIECRINRNFILAIISLAFTLIINFDKIQGIFLKFIGN